VEHRLFPAIRKLYPGKRVILVMDNAAYHKARNEQNPSKSAIAGMNKQKLANFITTVLKEKAVVVWRNQQEVKFTDSHKWTEKAPVGPSKQELVTFVMDERAKRPKLLKTPLENLLEELSLQEASNSLKNPNFHYVGLDCAVRV
jgi:hypothetical protein